MVVEAPQFFHPLTPILNLLVGTADFEGVDEFSFEELVWLCSEATFFAHGARLSLSDESVSSLFGNVLSTTGGLARVKQQLQTHGTQAILVRLFHKVKLWFSSLDVAGRVLSSRDGRLLYFNCTASFIFCSHFRIRYDHVPCDMVRNRLMNNLT